MDKNINILIIEDNEADKDYIEELLSEHSHDKYNLIWRERLNEGIKAYNKNIDVILLDLSLPDSSGIRTFTNLNTSIDDTPIIVLTGLNSEKIGLECIQKGAQDYLLKNNVNSEIFT